jgi:hypothetical protein
MKPQPYVILTNPEEILRGIQAGVVERLNTNVAEWGKPPASTLEEVSSSVNSGCIYRLKPGCQLPPKKVLRDRRPEEFWPLLGKWWGRYTHTKNDRFIISDSSWYVQHNKEIAPLGTEDWQPMMVEE